MEKSTNERKYKCPRSFTPAQLAKAAGIKASDQHGYGWFECLACGQQWSPNIQHGGTYKRGWWKCPNHCNEG